MIKLYCGVIKTSESGIEYVDEFYDFKIAKAKKFTKFNFKDVVYSQTRLNININDSNDVDNDVDVIPTNIVSLYRTAFGLNEDDTNISVLRGTKLNFFSSKNITSKLNFELRFLTHDSFYNRNATLAFGDFKRSILFKMVVNFQKDSTAGFNYLSLIINPIYEGTTIENLLISSRKNEENYFKNGIHTNFFNSPEYAPFYFYKNTTPISTRTFNSIITGDFDIGSLQRLNSQAINLSRWSNWHTMLKGQYWYGSPFIIKLENEINGIKEIELTTTTSFKELDEGYEFNTYYDLDDKTYTVESRGFSYYTVGTDITNLFDFTNDATETIYVENGYLRKYKDEYGFGVAYVNNNEGLDVFLGNTNAIANNKGFIEKSLIQGLYIGVCNNYVSTPIGFWLDKISENYNKWEYNNCPLFFGSFGCAGIKTSYMNNAPWDENEVSVNVPGLVCNFSSDSYSQPNNYITKLLNISYDFWVNFIDGFDLVVPDVEIGGGSLGGGTSGSGGGSGSFDDSSFNITNIDDIIKTNQMSSLNSKFLNAYVIEDSTTISSIARQCWETNFQKQDIQNYFGDNVNPMDSLISLKYSPINLNRGINTNNQINICGQTLTINGSTGIYTLSNDIQQINFGTITLDEYFGSFVDYDETNISLVLPYVGIQQLNVREIMGGIIGLLGLVDCVLGTITYHLLLQKNGIVNIINTWRGVCFYEFPVSNFDNRGKVDAIMNLISNGVSNVVRGAVGGAVVGGVGGAVVGGVVSGASTALSGATNFLSTKPSIVKGGTFAGDRCGITRAFLIIERPKLSLPVNYNHFQGYPSNQTSKMQYLKGYTEVGMVHLENMGVATNEEINEIENLLKQGVIF